jgi:hypothetical protein
MLLKDIIQGERTDEPVYRRDSLSEASGISLEKLFDGRTSVLKTKLDVFASEVFIRLRIRSENLLRISQDQERVGSILERLTVQANYNTREHKEKALFYELTFELDRQKREEDVECWRDVVQVMKDFLIVWEALEHAKSRSMFLNS